MKKQTVMLHARLWQSISGLADKMKKPWFCIMTSDSVLRVVKKVNEMKKLWIRMVALSVVAVCGLSANAAFLNPEEAWSGSWGPRMVIPTPLWPDEVDSWDATAFSGQFNQLTSSEIVYVNVTHPARGDYYTSPNPPLVAAVPSLADRFPTRDVLAETLDEIDAAGKKAIVYVACGAFGEGNTNWMDYITSQGHTYNTDGLREYIVRYYQNKFGDKIDGWWFDGANEILLRSGPNSGQLMVDAIRSENPNAIVTFGGANELNDYVGGHPTPRTIADAYSYDYNYQTVTRIEAGPWVDVDYLPVADPADGCLGHIFSHLQHRWTIGTTVDFPTWQAVDWTRRVVNAGGMFTWSVPRDSGQSMMLDPQFQVLRIIDTAIGGAKFIQDSFETGFGDWIDGGADCSHYTGPYASHATGAIELTGNTATSVMSTGDLPMSGSSRATVDLGYYATGMGTGDTFELQISTNGGGDYTTVKAWTYSTDFANDEYCHDIAFLEGVAFNDQTRFRIRCYAASGYVYIDDVKMSAVTTNPPSPLPVDPKPVFICDPIIKYMRNYAKEGQAYENWAESPIITGSAVDGNGDPLTYSRVSGPVWLSVASNGYLSGAPGAGDIGINEFTVQADDGTGNTTTAQLIITVEPSLPPSFTVDPIDDVALENVAYSSSIADDASDPESDPMTFSKVSGPTWLSVAADGTLSGTPGTADAGANIFTVQVDAFGGSDTATLNISVIKAIVKWGQGGGDTEILTAGVNTAGQNPFPAVYNPATLVNPVDGLNGYDVNAVGRTHEFSGAYSNPNTTPVFVNNVDGDYMQLVCSGDFSVTPFETMVVWDSTKFLPGGNGLGEMSVEFKERKIENVPTVSFVVKTSAGWYVTDQTDTQDGSTYKTFALGATEATFSGFNKFGVTAGSGQPDLSDLQSIGVFSSTTSPSVTWTGTFLRHIQFAANQAPSFTSDPINELSVFEGAAYSSSIADDASDRDGDPMTFSKIDGPAWLTVASDGTLSGTPSNSDIGNNVFIVQVSATGGSDTATLNITVDAQESLYEEDFSADPGYTNNGTTSIGAAGGEGTYFTFGQYNGSGEIGETTDTGVLHFDSNTSGGSARSRGVSVFIDTSVAVAGTYTVSFDVSNWVAGTGTAGFKVVEGSNLDTQYIQLDNVDNNNVGSTPNFSGTATSTLLGSTWGAGAMGTGISGNGTVSFDVTLTEAGQAGDYLALAWTQVRSTSTALAPKFDVDNVWVGQGAPPVVVTYSSWALSHNLTGADADEKADVENGGLGDGLDNLMEYALGGNPTNNDAATVSPRTYMAEEGETNWFYHVYNERADDESLTFSVGATTSLVTTAVDTNDVEFMGETAESGGFKTVTNRTEMTTDAKFISLRVEQ